MTHHPSEDALHRLVDGELPPREARALERHVAACAECHALVDRLERLQRLVAAAPKRITPPDGVWTAVQASIRTAAPIEGPPAPPGELQALEPVYQRAARRPRGARIAPRRALMPASLAMVALGLVGLGGGGVYAAVRARQGAQATVEVARAGSGAVRAAAAAPAEGEMGGPARISGAPSAEERLTEELERELGKRRHVLSSQAMASVTESLRMLNAAVTETERRLAADPNNGHLEAMLTRARLQQVEFVRSTVALTADL